MGTSTKKLFGILNLFRRRAELPLPAPADTLVASASTLTFTERRQAPRRWGDPVQVLIWDEYTAGEPTRGWIMNRSTGGLGLSAARPSLEGALLNVRVAIAPDTVPWTRVQVKGCNPSTGRWILSCQFFETPSREVLLMFR
ncbi:MAG TPA: hypothetical protein VKU02_17390 [Gemmataceae bacterium]|nr:hypothetical protein [Gemmataceae bacterium]